jgi:hypothetical protein
LSQTLVEYIGGSVHGIDLTLQSTRDEYERQLTQPSIDIEALDAFILRQHGRLPDAQSVRIADAAGIIQFGQGVDRSKQISIADRSYFIRLRDDPKAELVISEPVLGRVSNQWVVIFARRVNRADQTFAGVVYGVIEIRRFTTVFSSLNVGERGIISLRSGDWSIIARFPAPDGTDNLIGKRLHSAELQEHIDRGELSGTYRAHSAVDHFERILSFRRVGAYPLNIIVGLAMQDIFVDWRHQAIGSAILALLFALVTILGAVRNYRYDMMRSEAIKAAQQAAERLVAETRTKSLLADLGVQLQQTHHLSSLAQVFFMRLADFLPIHQATLYTILSRSSDSSQLGLAGAYGNDQVPNIIDLGEGLVGQCALDRRPLSFDLPPEGFWQVASGLGMASPRALLLFPVVRNDQLLGVIELASMDADFATHRQMIEEILPILAMNLEIVFA